MSKHSGLLKATFISCALTLACGPAVSAPESGRFIVQFKDGKGNAGRAALRSAGASVALDLRRHNAVAARIPAQALAGLSSNPNVEYVEDDQPRYLLSLQREENGGVPYGIPMVQADQVAEVTNGLKTICIIDSGLDLGHPEFANQSNITGTSDSGTGDWFTDENSHGTHVAGTVAGMANGEGVIGVNSNGTVNLHIIKVFSADGWAYSSSLVAAADNCISAGADVISMSLGGSFKSRTEERAFDNYFNSGILSIAASGNDGNTRHSYPASYNGVMSIGALDSTKTIAAFSQQTDQVELSAPGVSVLSSVPRGMGSSTDVSVAGAAYDANAMDGSPNTSGSGPLVDCGMGTSTCPGGGGQVCLISRGDIAFADKVQACESGGGAAAIIYNNEAGPLLGTLGEVSTSIPSVGVSQADGQTMLDQTGSTASVAIQVDDYAFFDGTSMATPHVSGVAGLVWNNYPDCTAAEMRDALNATAEDLGPAGRDNAYGYGLVQAKAAFDYLATNGCSGGGGGGGGGEEPPPSCDLGQSGDSCTDNSDCCSNKCKGKPGAKTCG